MTLVAGRKKRWPPDVKSVCMCVCEQVWLYPSALQWSLISHTLPSLQIEVCGGSGNIAAIWDLLAALRIQNSVMCSDNTWLVPRESDLLTHIQLMNADAND